MIFFFYLINSTFCFILWCLIILFKIMEMEIDLPKDAISKSQWLLNNAKKAENIYEARSWLITARNAAPGRGC